MCLGEDVDRNGNNEMDVAHAKNGARGGLASHAPNDGTCRHKIWGRVESSPQVRP